VNCSRCGFPLRTQQGFCPRCGAAYRPAGDQNIGASQRLQDATSGPAQANSRAKAFLVVAALVLVLAILVVSIRTKQKSPSSQSSNEAVTTPATVTAAEQPTIPPPKFRVYRSKLDEGTSVVVSPSTSDEQLKSLLWLFREKVRSHRFKDVGILQPTSKQWGQKGYLSGMIVVYKGGKCASELFTDSPGLGSCGYGDHSAAEYQWGLLVDGVFNANADSGEMTASDGTTVTVFDYHDHWQLPADLQGSADAEKPAQKQNP
jgi:hypothetical protein